MNANRPDANQNKLQPSPRTAQLNDLFRSVRFFTGQDDCGKAMRTATTAAKLFGDNRKSTTASTA